MAALISRYKLSPAPKLHPQLAVLTSRETVMALFARARKSPTYRWRVISALMAGLAFALMLTVSTAGQAHAATLLSQGKPTTASSTENAGTPASAATDGNTGTRWSSAFADPQLLQVDLGST